MNLVDIRAIYSGAPKKDRATRYASEKNMAILLEVLDKCNGRASRYQFKSRSSLSAGNIDNCIYVLIEKGILEKEIIRHGTKKLTYIKRVKHEPS